ncbi:glutathione hydrolase 5 proenzyme isoform X10 [Macaca fascicularis]|uniref:glutathione hydrolase 5 proenzyme isoform X10 n=1 Tax=Macaca fascicularis TaxID=9541 RepID=UPI003D156EC9
MPGRQCQPTTPRACWTGVHRLCRWVEGPSGSGCPGSSAATPRPTAAMAACPGRSCSSPPSPCSEGGMWWPPSSASSCTTASCGLPCRRQPCGSQLTLQDLAKFQPEVVDALEVPLGDYTLYSPPPPAGGAILSFILNVLRGFNFSAESVARPEGRVNMYHHLVETLKFARGQRWRLGDPRSHPKLQNASRDLLEETLAQLIRQQIDGRGDHQLSHYSLADAWGHGTGTSHVSVLGEDGSAVAATSTINTPFGAMVYSPRTGIILNNELLDLCERCPRGSGTTPSPVNGDRVSGAPGGCWPPVPGERSPSSMVPSILISKAQGSKLVIGGAGGELIISAVAQAIMNKLWLGFDLRAAIAAPILHVNSKGRVEYEPSFSQEVQRGLQDRGQNQTQRPFFLNVVQAVSQEGACVYAVSDLRKGGEAAGY